MTHAVNPVRTACGRVLVAALVLVLGGCANEPPWHGVNQRVIARNHVTGRTRELPAVNVPMVLADGEPVERSQFPVITIAPGVTAALGWGRGALLERVEMEPNAVYPAQMLAEELIVVVEDGSATIEFDGRSVEFTRDHVLYLQPVLAGGMQSNGTLAARNGNLLVCVIPRA